MCVSVCVWRGGGGLRGLRVTLETASHPRQSVREHNFFFILEKEIETSVYYSHVLMPPHKIQTQKRLGRPEENAV